MNYNIEINLDLIGKIKKKRYDFESIKREFYLNKFERLFIKAEKLPEIIFLEVFG